MQVPLQIVFEHVEHSDALEAAVHKEAQRLERFHDRITSARVVIARPQHRHHKGDTYCVRIHVAVPGGKHIDVSQLQDHIRRLEGETSPHGKFKGSAR